MSNLNDIYTANPLTSIPLDALLYILDNPGQTGGDDDAGINANDLLAQIIGTRIDGVKLTWNSATSIDVGTGLLVAENRDVINITTAITKSGLSLSNSTWYHVYAYLDSGTPAAEVVTTAPVAWKGTAYSKTGDTSRRYVGSLKTDGSGNIYHFSHDVQKGWVEWSAANIAAAPFLVLNNGQSISTGPAATIDASGIVPVTGNAIKGLFTNTGDQGIYFDKLNTVTSSSHHARLGVGGAGASARQNVFWHPLDGSRYMYYTYAATPSAGMYIYAMGYSFDR